MALTGNCCHKPADEKLLNASPIVISTVGTAANGGVRLVGANELDVAIGIKPVHAIKVLSVMHASIDSSRSWQLTDLITGNNCNFGHFADQECFGCIGEFRQCSWRLLIMNLRRSAFIHSSGKGRGGKSVLF